MKVGELAIFANLVGKRAVVTGASSGIGRAIALQFAEAGADVIVHCAKSVEAAEAVATQIRNLGRHAAVEVCDLFDSAAHGPFVERCWNWKQGIDVWVNNAGVDLLTGPDARRNYAEKLRMLWQVDVTGTALLSKNIGDRMKSRSCGAILNIGWDLADRGMEGDSGELFAASKNAIMGFTRSLAVSLAPHVRVNCIAPGWIRTAWGEHASQEWQDRVLRETPLKRWGTPEDIARLARFLCSDEASFITGQIVNCNGGAVR